MTSMTIPEIWKLQDEFASQVFDAVCKAQVTYMEKTKFFVLPVQLSEVEDILFPTKNKRGPKPKAKASL